MRLFHIIAINNKAKTKTYCTSYPMNHDKCCTMLKRFTPDSRVKLTLEESK